MSLLAAGATCTLLRSMALQRVVVSVGLLLTMLPCVMATEFNFTIGTNEEIDITFKETVQFNMTVISTNLTGVIRLQSADTSVIELMEAVEFIIGDNMSFPFTTRVNLHGQYVGRSGLKIVHNSVEITSKTVNVNTPFKELGTVATIILATWLVISYVVMAAKVEPRILLERVRPPWAILVGMLCQFILMPPIAFALCKVFDLTGATAVGLVLVGTCPGGFFSNIEVLLLDCDLVLSLAMTTFSTLISVGMMPLNLLIYAQPFIDGDGRLETPFKELLIQLTGLVLPLVVGVPFFYKFPKARKYCLKLVKPFTFILMVLGVVLYIPAQYYVFFGDWKVWVTSSIVTLIGAFLGMGVARIANFTYITSITIAIETGCQNTLLAVSVAKLFYIAPESDVVAVIPLLIAIVSGIEGFTVVLLYYLYNFLKRKHTKISPDAAESRGEEKPCDTGTAADAELSSLAATRDTKGFVNSRVTPEENFQSQHFMQDAMTDLNKGESSTSQQGHKNNGYIYDENAQV